MFEANTELFGVDVVEKTFVSLNREALSLKKNKTKKTPILNSYLKSSRGIREHER